MRECNKNRMVLLVTLEGIRSNTKALIYSNIKRVLVSAKDCTVLDVPHTECPYARSLKLFKALRETGGGARVALCPASFYAHPPGGNGVWLESVRALASRTDSRVREHLMVSIMSDEHGVFDENVTRHDGASIEDIASVSESVLETARNPVGHPWIARSVVVPAPRFTNDTPAFIEKISADILNIVSRMAPV
jgi:hypothetical protein